MKKIRQIREITENKLLLDIPEKSYGKQVEIIILPYYSEPPQKTKYNFSGFAGRLKKKAQVY